jgi:hypothetical protein
MPLNVLTTPTTASRKVAKRSNWSFSCIRQLAPGLPSGNAPATSAAVHTYGVIRRSLSGSAITMIVSIGPNTNESDVARTLEHELAELIRCAGLICCRTQNRQRTHRGILSLLKEACHTAANPPGAYDGGGEIRLDRLAHIPPHLPLVAGLRNSLKFA